VNKLRFICALRDKGRLSKKEIANVCDLSMPTVDKIIRFYLQKKVVKESGFDQSSGGRRPILYEFNEKVKYAMGVDFEIPELTLVVTDLKGRVVEKYFSRIPIRGSAQSAVEYVGEKIVRLIAKRGLTKEDIIGIGFGAPAFLKDEKITISGKNLPSWKDVPAKRILQEITEIPVVVDNDVNLMTLSESYHMDYRDTVLVYLTLRRGTKGDIRMGGGVLINGEVFDGAHGNAATLRHAYMDFSASRKPEELIEDVMKLQNPQELVLKLRDHLLIPMLNMVILFDPNRVVINAGILGQWEPIFVKECEKALRHRLQGLFDWDFKVEMARDRELPCAKGAALRVLQQIFSNPDLFQERFQ